VRYAQGGGLTDAERAAREQIRLQAVERFEGEKNREIAAALRVSERSVERWRRAWRERGEAGVQSKGSPGRSRFGPALIARLERELERGPLAHGWADQRWTLARIKTLIGRLFHVSYTVEGAWRLLRRHGWSWQQPARRAIERDDGAVEVWKKETWPRVRAPRQAWISAPTMILDEEDRTAFLRAAYRAKLYPGDLLGGGLSPESRRQAMPLGRREPAVIRCDELLDVRAASRSKTSWAATA
jgi:transposase